ncbi:MAG: NAD(P)H-dependent oxidoreductase, partial [Bacteroidota bacterium]|nr:NAD(P)H-dependent oxidoreductase [Bacteroidota bacterium]
MISIIVGTNRPQSFSRIFAQYYHDQLAKNEAISNIVDLQDLPDDFTTSALYDRAGKNVEFNVLQDKVSASEKLVFI